MHLEWEWRVYGDKNNWTLEVGKLNLGEKKRKKERIILDN